MERLLSPVITVLLIAAVVLLGAYAIGGLDNDSVMEADSDEYGSGGIVYSGGLKNGLFNGLGYLAFLDGDNYYGSFRDGRFDGEGVYSYNDNTGALAWQFKGLFQNGQTNSGKLYNDDNSLVIYVRSSDMDTLVGQNWRYSGSFDTRGQNGFGVFTYHDGSVYYGDFKNGLADGTGTYADTNGNMIYAGGFSSGLFEGQGFYYSPEGWTYEGSFKDGLFDGEGSVTIGDLVVRGVWEKGEQTTRYE